MPAITKGDQMDSAMHTFAEPREMSAGEALRAVLQTFYPELGRIHFNRIYLYGRLTYFKGYYFAYTRGVVNARKSYSYRWFICSKEDYEKFLDFGYPVVSFLNPNTVVTPSSLARIEDHG